jgi:hypothetical protein
MIHFSGLDLLELSSALLSRTTIGENPWTRVAHPEVGYQD